MRKNHLKNVLTKAFASLLLVALLLGDSSVAVFAETLNPGAETGVEENISEPSRDNEEVSDEREQMPGNEALEEEGNAEEEETVPDEADPAEGTGTGTEVEGDNTAVEDENEEVFVSSYTVTLSNNQPSRLSANRTAAFSEKSRGDYFHRFYNQLSADEKKFYDYLDEHADDFITHSYSGNPLVYTAYEGESRTVSNIQTVTDGIFSDMTNAIGAFVYDNPRIFWIDFCKFSFDFAARGPAGQTGPGVTYFEVTVSITPQAGEERLLIDRYCKSDLASAQSAIDSDANMIDTMIDNIVGDSSFTSLTTVAEKAAYINDKLTYINYYNRQYASNPDDRELLDSVQTAVSALNSGITWLTSADDTGDAFAPVCNAYAMAFKAICDEVGIHSLFVAGNGHAWNYVQTEDGVWYGVDVTWDDPLRNDEYLNRATPDSDIREFCMVGSGTVCGGSTFGSRHPANAPYLNGSRTPVWPVLSTDAAPEATRGATLSTVSDAPVAGGGKITAKFNTNKAGRYYWTVRAKNAEAPSVYDIQDGVSTIEGGSGNGTITAAQVSSGEPVEFTTNVIPAGDYDLYIMQLTPEEYVSNVISYTNIAVANSIESITVREYAANPSKGIPRKNTLYVGKGFPVEFDIVPAELHDSVTVTIESKNGRVSIDARNLKIFPKSGGDEEIRIKAVYRETGKPDQELYSDWLPIRTIYPVGRIFEYEGGICYATSETDLYTGWLTQTGSVFQTRKMEGNYKVYYFHPDTKSAIRSNNSDEKCSIVINDKTYLFDENGVLIKEWLKLNTVAIPDIPADANTTGPIADNILSYGMSYKLTAKLTSVKPPQIPNDSLEPVWTSDDPSVIKVTPLGSKDDEVYARIDVLKLNDDPTDPDGPVRVTLTVGETDLRRWGETAGYDNRKEAHIDVYVRHPVGWRNIGGRTYYGKVNGTDVENVVGWQTIDGKRYYFEETGTVGAMVTGIREIGGRLYDFGDDGVFRREIDRNGFVELPAGIFYFDANGQLIKNRIVSDKHGNRYYLDATDGHVVNSGWINYNPGTGNLCLYAGENGVLADGMTVIGGKTYCFDTNEDGYPCVLRYGHYAYNGKTYYSYDQAAAEDCFVAFGYFRAADSNFYYAMPQNGKDPGVLQTGWVLADGAWRLFAASDAATPYAEISSSSTDGWIYVSPTERYYRKSNGNFLKGWQTVDQKRFYFDNDGNVATGLWRIGSYFYYFGETSDWDITNNTPGPDDNYGIMQTGRVTYTVSEGGVNTTHTNFFNTSGIRQTGWQKYSANTGDKWDFFDRDGESAGVTEVAGKPGWYEIVRGGVSARYYFVNNNSLARGWYTLDGNRFYFDNNADEYGAMGRMAVGIKTIGSSKYYFRETDRDNEVRGSVLTGHSYAYDPNDDTPPYDKREYYADANGILKFGWQKIDTQFAFFDYEKGYRVTEDNEITGLDNWVVITGTDGRPYKYYLRNATNPVTGLQTIDRRQYLFGNISNDENYGRLLTGLIKYGSSYYYGTTYSDANEALLASAGELKRGLFTVTESGVQVTRYANDYGVIQTGWVLVDGVYRYFLTEKDVADHNAGTVGQMITINRVNDTFLNCEWYVGVQDPFNNMYFCFRNGSAPLKGWQTINGYRYYFDPYTGALWTGVKKISNQWYDLGGVSTEGYMNGYMKTGWSNGSNTSDYYYNTSGYRVTGWNTIDGLRYYFRPQRSGEILDENDFGKKIKGIVFIDGRSRYILDPVDGHMLTGYVTLAGNRYYTNTSGIVQYGWQQVDGKMHYFTPETGAEPGVEIVSAVCDDDFISINDGARTVYYYLRSGTSMVTGFLDIAGKRFFFSDASDATRGAMAEGWFEKGGKRYYAYPQGHALVPGSRHVGELAKGYCRDLTGPGENYYFDNYGAMMTGLYLIEDEYHYFEPDSLSNDYGREKFLTKFNGAPAGFYKTPDNRIVYLNRGRLMTGWQTIEGLKYYFDARGTLQTGEYLIGNIPYCSYTLEEAASLGNNALTGSIRAGYLSITDADGNYHTRHYDTNGRRRTGWVMIDNAYRYFDPQSGYMMTGCFKVGNYMYFADAEGRRLTGLVKYNGSTYYCDNSGIARSGWQTVRIDGENRRFYFDQYGAMQTGIQKIGNYYYFFSNNQRESFGAMMTGLFSANEGGRSYTYYANSSGILQFGPQKINGEQYYFACEYDGSQYGAGIGRSYAITPFSSGGRVRDNWYRVSIEGHDILIYANNGVSLYKGLYTVVGLDGNRHQYCFNPSNGAMMTGYVTVSGREYKFGTDVTNLSTYGTFDAQTMSGFDPEPSVNSGAVRYRYFNNSGISVTGWIDRNGARYYLYPDGTLAIGLQKISGSDYYFEETAGADYGVMAVNRDVTVEGKTYLFGSNGRRLSGWQRIGDNYRYYAPELVKGTEYTRNGRKFYIANISGSMYRLDANGNRYPQANDAGISRGYDIYTGVYTDSNSRVYTGWQSVMINSVYHRMYFSTVSGVCLTSKPSDSGQAYDNFCAGPVLIGNYRFYFDEDGFMVTGEYGNRLFNSSGYLQTGLQKVNNVYRYFDPTTGEEIVADFRKQVGQNDEWIAFTINSKPVRYYSRNGRYVTGWQDIECARSNDRRRFYFNSDGTLAYTFDVPGDISISGSTYHTKEAPTVNPQGSDFGYIITGFYRKGNGTSDWCYSDNYGRMLTGWQYINGTDGQRRKYYFTPYGFMCKGVTDISGTKYFFMDSTNANAQPIQDPEYGALQTGEFHSDVTNADYKANSSGVLQTGWEMTRNADGTYTPSYYSSDISTYGQKQAVTSQKDAAGRPTGWYRMDGWYYVEGGRTLRKGFVNQKINVGGNDLTYRFCLDSVTGKLIETDGLVRVGSYRYYSENDPTMPAGYPQYIIRTNKFNIGTDTYYADSNGILKTGIVNEYRVNAYYLQLYGSEDCKQIKSGFVNYNNNVYYAFTDADATADRIPEGFRVGDLAKGRLSISGSNYYFDTSGIRRSGWYNFTEADRRSYRYYYGTDGRRYENGRYTIAGREYYFDADGKLQTGLFTDASGTYYPNSSGELIKGWSNVRDTATNTYRWRYFRRSDGKELTTTGIDADNKMIFAPVAGNYWGIIKEDGIVSAYYIYSNSYVAKNSWYTINGKRYYFDADGHLTADGEAKKLVADAVGVRLATPEDVNIRNIGYYNFCIKKIDNTALESYAGAGDFGGYAVNGFAKDMTSGDLYYSNSNGQLQKGYTTIRRDGINRRYYGDDRYRLLTGPSYIGSTKYLFDTADNLGELLSSDHAGADGLVTYNGKKYYTNSSGVVMTGWQNVYNNARVSSWHYFDEITGEETGISASANNWITLSNGNTYYFSNGNYMTKGFAAINGNRYYFDSKTGVLKKAPAADGIIRFTVGTDTYEADTTGALTLGWSKIRAAGAGPANTLADSYFEKSYGRMVTGSYTVTGEGLGVYYFDANGKMATGITTIGGKKYVYGKNTAAIMFDDGTTTIPEISYDRGKLHKDYYGRLDDTAAKYASDYYGVLATGWKKTGGNWHFFDRTTGREYEGTSEPAGNFTWVTIDNLPDGRGKFCFRNSNPLTGWQTINNRRYYFDSVGKMAVGLVYIGNIPYYFNETISASDHFLEGMLMTNGIANAGGKYYYMTSSGTYQKGWFTISGKKYYGDPATGELAVGFRKIDGKVYYFSEAETTLGQMQTGFFKLSDLGQSYYDRSAGASNIYYSDNNGVIVTSGWKNIKIEPKVLDSQEWSYFFAPNRPCTDMGDFVLTGEMVTGDVLIDDDGNVTAYLDDGRGNDDGFAAAACVRFDANGTATVDAVSANEISGYYRFDPDTGARRKEVLFFYGNYYGYSIDDNQKNAVSSMRRYINSDTRYAVESDDFILVNGDAAQVKRKGLTRFTGADQTFPMCASNLVDDPSEKVKYVAANDIAGFDGTSIVAGPDGHVDVYDTEVYSKDVYDRALAKYGPKNTVLIGASSGAGICLGLYAYAISQNDANVIPEQVLLLSPWVDVSMSNPDCRRLSPSLTGPTDVGTLKYWGARYTRDRNYTDEDGTPYATIGGPGVNYPFANSLCLDPTGMRNIIIYSGTYDPCIYDSDRFVELAKRCGCIGIVNNRYSGQHGFMFFAKDSNAKNVTMDVCRRVMTQ